MYQEEKFHGLVLMDKLCALSFFPLFRACFKLQPVKVYYFQSTKMGLKIANLFEALKVISGEPSKIENLFLNDTYDGVNITLRYKALNICLNNQARIDQEVAKCLSWFEKYFAKTA